MAVFTGDSPLELFQTAAESEIEMSSAKFARKDDIVCIMDSLGGIINHEFLSRELGIDPMSATDFGEIGITYDKFSEPPSLCVNVMERSTSFAINASNETRLKSGEMMEPYFRKFLPEFIKYVGLEIVDFDFICEPFGPKI